MEPSTETVLTGMTADGGLRTAQVRGVYMDKCGTVHVEVFEPATSLSFAIRHGFDHDRGLSFMERRRSMYGRGILFAREVLDRPGAGCTASYVFKGFERGDDL